MGLQVHKTEVKMTNESRLVRASYGAMDGALRKILVPHVDIQRGIN